MKLANKNVKNKKNKLSIIRPYLFNSNKIITYSESSMKSSKQNKYKTNRNFKNFLFDMKIR